MLGVNRKNNLDLFLKNNNNQKIKIQAKQRGLRAFADWLDNWHFTRILQSLGSFALVLTLIAFYIDWNDRGNERKARRWSNIVMAQEIINGKDVSPAIRGEALNSILVNGIPFEGLFLRSSSNERYEITGVEYSNEVISNYFESALLTHFDFTGAELRNNNFKFVSIEDSSFENTYFIGNRFMELIFMRANFNNSEMINEYYEKGRIFRSSFKKADITSSTFNSTRFFKNDFTGSTLEKVKFINAALVEIIFHNSLLISVDFSNAVLSSVNFNGALCIGCDFAGVEFKQTSLDGLEFSYTDKTDEKKDMSNLRGAKGLTCDMLTKAINWEYTLRDKALDCGRPFKGFER